MTSINTLSNLLAATASGIGAKTAPLDTLPQATQAEQAIQGMTSSAPSSTVVTLSQMPSVANWPTYNPPFANGATLLWQQAPSDSLSLLMTGNVSTSALGNRLDQLGARLLKAIANGATSYSQSVLRSTSATPLSGTELAVQQTRLQTAADNQFSLTISTASGARVSLRLGSSDDGLSARFDVTKGALTDAERSELGKLAGAFQSAVDGLAKQPPVVDFGALSGFDTGVLTSVDMSATLGANGKASQSISFHADATQRSMHVDGATGKFDVTVDLTNLQAIGSAKAQADALDAWLTRFDTAQTRGNGDASLMAMFKGAFTGLNSHYPSAPALPRIALNAADRSVLSGLADFNASIVQTPKAPNPLRPNETDTFSYRISQQTKIDGKDLLNRTVQQDTQATLSASYHRSLWAGVPLELTTDPKSQNYEFLKVRNTAQSHVDIGYRDGLLSHAVSRRSASQSTQVMRYEMSRLVSDVTTPTSASQTVNLMTLLTSVMRDAPPGNVGDGNDDSADDFTRNEIRRRTAFDIDPTHLNGGKQMAAA
jgi:hypothetical protein